MGPRVGRTADLFDATLYGDRPATPDDAGAVLALDDTLAGDPMSVLRAAPRRRCSSCWRSWSPCALTAWLGRQDQSYAGALDPANPDGDGAQALARVLGGQGVSVDVVRSADAFDRATTDASTLVVVTGSDRLGRSTTRRLLATRARRDSWSWRPARSSPASSTSAGTP